MLQSLGSGLQTKCQGGGRGEQVEEMKFYAQLSTRECLFINPLSAALDNGEDKIRGAQLMYEELVMATVDTITAANTITQMIFQLN